MAVKASGLEILVRFVRVLIRVSNLVLYYKVFIRGLRRLGFGVLFAFFWGSFRFFLVRILPYQVCKTLMGL